MAEMVKPEDARADVASNEYVVIDVRDSEEWSESSERVPGSVHVPADEIESKLSELPDDKKILLVAPDEERANEVAEKIEGDGREVRVLEGGVEAWKSDRLLTQPSPDAAPPKGEDEEPHESPDDEDDEDAGGTAQAEEDAEGEPERGEGEDSR